MDFTNALTFLARRADEHRSQRHPGRLDRMRSFLDLLGNPQASFRSIHVGGTAGKGSTATMTASILQAGGLRVGLHTKPHLTSVTERARINGVAVSEQRFAALISAMLPAVSQMERGPWGSPSYFEILVALAFILFAEERVDMAVVEVGVGGRLDGTNVIDPAVCVLTNVGLDHADVLGHTIEEIANDKAGIIKKGVPVVTAAEQPAALAVVRETAKRHAAPLTVVQEAASIAEEPLSGCYEQRATIRTALDAYEVTLPVLGEFQLVNAATAILACERLPAGPCVAGIRRGLADIALPGRMEFHPFRPALLFDVAHNAEKAVALRDALLRHFPKRRLVFVTAIAEGKDADGMLLAWSALPAHFVFTTFDVSHRRAVRAQKLCRMAEERGMVARAVDDPVEALSVARRIAGAGDLVVVTGSTFLVGTLRQWFSQNAVEKSHAGV